MEGGFLVGLGVTMAGGVRSSYMDDSVSMHTEYISNSAIFIVLLLSALCVQE